MLKSGEDLISIIHEMLVDGKVVGYYLKKPCVIEMQNARKHSDDETRTSIDIRLIPWIALSKSDVIPVPADWVVTIVEPIDKLVDMYKAEVLQDGQDTDTPEQSGDNIKN